MTRVLVVEDSTTQAEELSLLQGLESGADNFITKPYEHSFFTLGASREN